MVVSLMVNYPWETSILDGFIIKVTPEDEFLFLGCDGIFELNSNQAVAVFFCRGNERYMVWVAIGVWGTAFGWTWCCYRLETHEGVDISESSILSTS